MASARRLLLGLFVGLLVGVAVVEAQDPGELNQALLQAFGGPVSPRRSDGSAAQTGDVPTKQSNGSVTFQAAAGGSQTPWTGDIDAAGYALTGAAQISASDGTTGVTGGQIDVSAGRGNLGSGATGYGGSWSANGGSSSGAGGSCSAFGGDGASGKAGGSFTAQGGTGHAGAGAGASLIVRGGSAAGVAGTIGLTGDTTITGNLSATNYPSAWTDVASVTDGWTNATTSLRWARSGSSVKAVVLTTASGTPADASYSFQLDAGMPAPVTAGIGGSVAVIGRAVYYDASAGFYAGIVYWNGTDAFVYFHGGAALMSLLTSRVPATVASPDFVICHLDYPCAP